MPLTDFSYNLTAIGSSQHWTIGEDVFGLGTKEISGTDTVGFGYTTPDFYGDGSVISISGGSLLVVGNGELCWNGRPCNVGVSRTTPQYILPRTSSIDKWIVDGINSFSFDVGISQPSIPDVVVSSEAGNIKAAVFFRVSVYNTETLDVSSASEQTPVLTPDATGNKIRISFPNVSTELGSSGKLVYRVYSAVPGRATSSPSYFTGILISAADLSTIDGVDNSYLLDFTPSSLQSELAPINYNRFVNEARYGFAYGNQVVLLGTYDGTGFSCSIPNNFGAYPPEYTTFLPEQVTGVISDAASGIAYILCENSVHIASFTGAANSAPVIPTQIVSNFGFLNSRNCTLVGNTLYGFYKDGGIRITPDGSVDTTFALAVKEDMKWFRRDRVVVGFDPSSSSVVYFYGSKAFSYNLMTESWSSCVDLSSFIGGEGSVTSANTYRNNLHFTFTFPYIQANYTDPDIQQKWFAAASYLGSKYSLIDNWYQIGQWNSGLFGTFSLYSQNSLGNDGPTYVLDNLLTPLRVVTSPKYFGTPYNKIITTLFFTMEGVEYTPTLYGNLSGFEDGWSWSPEVILNRMFDGSSPYNINTINNTLRTSAQSGMDVFFESLYDTISGWFSASSYTSLTKSANDFFNEIHYAFFLSYPTVDELNRLNTLALANGGYSGGNKSSIANIISSQYGQTDAFKQYSTFLYRYHFPYVFSLTLPTRVISSVRTNDRPFKTNFRPVKSLMVEFLSTSDTSNLSSLHTIFVEGKISKIRS